MTNPTPEGAPEAAPEPVRPRTLRAMLCQYLKKRDHDPADAVLAPEKEGLQSAIDYTKYLLTLAGGAIAFVIQPTFYGAGNYQVKLWSLLALGFLMLSVISGLFVFSGGSVMLSEKNYNLEHPYVKIPGLINVFSFLIGFICVSVAVAIKLVHS